MKFAAFPARFSQNVQRNVQILYTEFHLDQQRMWKVYGHKFIYSAVAVNSVDPHEPHSHSARFYTPRPYRTTC